MDWMRKLLGHGDTTKHVEEDRPKFEEKKVEDYPPQFESLVNDYNELKETYEASMRLNDAYEFSLKEVSRANDLLLLMNANMSHTLKELIDTGVSEDGAGDD